MTEKKKKLTLKQTKFVKEFLETGNATEAASRAYNANNRNTANSIATENLAKPAIKQSIEEVQAKLGINPEYVLKNFKEIADFNKQKRVKARQVGGETFHEEEMIDAQASLKANEMLGKHLSLFVDKVEVTGKDGKDLIPEEKRKDLARKLAFLFNAAK